MREDLDRLCEDLEELIDHATLMCGVAYSPEHLACRLAEVRQIARGVLCELQGMTLICDTGEPT